MRQKFLCAAVMLLLILPSCSFADDHEKKFADFWSSLEKAANPISRSGEYDIQDVEFVKDEMYGDETVYARAWYSDDYFLTRKYNGRDWSGGYLYSFWTDSGEFIFADGIKVGVPLRKLESYFGKEHLFSIGSEIYYVYQFEEADGGALLMFSLENGKVTSISCNLYHNQTSRLYFLFDLYSSFHVGEVTGEKVNVREYAPDGKIKFQVSRSRGDILLVETDDNDGWYRVAGRIINGKLKAVPDYSVSSQFVNVRKITPSERRLFISQYLKN